MTKGTQIIFALLSGFLLIISFPKFGHGIVAWFALVPLLVVLFHVNGREGFLCGFITGIVFYLGILYWIVFVIVNYGNLPFYIGISALIFLALYLAFYVALFSFVTVYFREKGISLTSSVPALWTVLEYIKSHILTGFPWENLAYSQYAYKHLIQFVDITGIYGLSFVIALINVLIAELWSPKKGKEMVNFWKRSLAIFFVFLLIYIYGTWRIGEINKVMERAPKMEVSLIQGNIDQSVKWNPEFQEKTLTIYERLSFLSPVMSKNGLIIWPETAVPFYLQEFHRGSLRVLDIARRKNVWLLVGSPAYNRDLKSLNFMNSAYLISPEGQIEGRYDKVHLVPYGEYVPLRQVFPFINKLVVGVGDFKPGRGYFPLMIKGRPLGILICYEAIFPEASLAYKRKGTELLVNITNDAWFGKTSAPYQHLSMAIFRAVENRLYFLRAANTGISAIVDPTGEIKGETPLFVSTLLSGSVCFIDKKTFYMAYGDIFVLLCGGAIFYFIVTSRRNKHYG